MCHLGALRFCCSEASERKWGQIQETRKISWWSSCVKITHRRDTKYENCTVIIDNQSWSFKPLWVHCLFSCGFLQWRLWIAVMLWRLWFGPLYGGDWNLLGILGVCVYDTLIQSLEERAKGQTRKDVASYFSDLREHLRVATEFMGNIMCTIELTHIIPLNVCIWAGDGGSMCT